MIMRTQMAMFMLGFALAPACNSKSGHPEPHATAGSASIESAQAPVAELDQELQERAKRPGELHALKKAGDGFAVRLKTQQADAAPAAATTPEPSLANEKTPEGPTRAWFPETFLFEPLVVTDDLGAAVVPVRVPDRLTTWRVLALAHSRSGAQGGAVASFLGTLPTYVDPVVPAFLVQGDVVRLPIQIVNTTAEDVASSLEISVQNATLQGGAGQGGAGQGGAGQGGAGQGGAGRARTVPAQGSTVDYATLVADHAGTVKLRVALGGPAAGVARIDAVERTIEVRPFGRPVTQTRSGTLAAPRRFTTPGTPGADPATDRVRLLVFPGALALLRSELAVSTLRLGTADDAYALLLAGKAATLLAALGDKPDPAALRDLALVTAQRAIRGGRTLDVERASLLAEPALAHPGNPVLARLGERAAAYLAQNQRPDGTFAGATGWTLQRLLMVTAEATRAVRAEVATRAAGAFARTADQVSDGFTAAAILASGALGSSGAASSGAASGEAANGGTASGGAASGGAASGGAANGGAASSGAASSGAANGGTASGGAASGGAASGGTASGGTASSGAASSGAANGGAASGGAANGGAASSGAASSGAASSGAASGAAASGGAASGGAASGGAGGAVTGELAATLRRRVRDAIKTTADGAAYLEVGEGVVRADGAIPTRTEATALAVLALQGDATAPLADLGTTLLGAYSIERGWGDGRTNLVAMQAVLALFKTPLPSTVTVTLQMDGKPIVRGTLEGAKLRDVLALDGAAPGLAGSHEWTLVAEPSVPGLGYSLALDSWLPWDKQPVHGGLELALRAHVDAVVGKPLDMTVTAVAPSGVALHIQQALPAGVQVDRPSLEAVVAAGTIERFVAADGTLDLYAPALTPGKTFAIAYRVVPTLGGTLHSGASLIESGTNQVHVPPTEWTIK